MPYVVTQREFEIRSHDHLDEILYKSVAVQGTTKAFDLVQGGQDSKSLFRIHTNASRSQWDIYAFTQVFEGQAVDDEATMISPENKEPLYRKAKIVITWNKYHGDVYMVQSSQTPQPPQQGTESEGWGNDMDPRGVFDKESTLRCEEIQSFTSQYQAYHPRTNPILDSAAPPQLQSWWVWEHTQNLHQMKMHLAKGCDVALHVIIAITTNMVNVEKHADQAM